MPAPKYNLYALGNEGGRPLIFKTPEELEKRVIEYFDFCVNTKEEVTKSGLELYLTFYSRSTWRNYCKREEFLDILNRAKLCVIKSYELDLRTFRFGAAIFALKNLDPESWVDKVEQEVKTTITNVAASFGSTIPTAPQPSEDTP